MKQNFFVGYRFRGRSYGTVVTSTTVSAARKQFRRQNPHVKLLPPVGVKRHA